MYVLSPWARVHARKEASRGSWKNAEPSEPAFVPVRPTSAPLIGIPLNVGCGYGADPEWTHGVWKGDGWVEGSTYSYDDPAVTGRAAFSLWDHVARVSYEGHEGWGIFEHGCIGAHAPSGFTDLTSVAS